MLDLKRMQYLEAVYLYKNFTKASEMLHVSQPAISNAINALESELKIKLMVRNSKNVTFTYEGEQVMGRITKILELFRELRSEHPGRSIVMITHNSGIAGFADRVAQLEDGKLHES